MLLLFLLATALLPQSQAAKGSGISHDVDLGKCVAMNESNVCAEFVDYPVYIIDVPGLQMEDLSAKVAEDIASSQVKNL